ncbi:uncharacterized protein CTRU02_207025 [Colletotrichum truncatum]|uniref:Uncharacterized protein n=1 Tax=Colletotrichum truncatum TaxID=5467 RepID=A0ACC3YZC7_COLTU|nr:uncharacterized protein CTRU02_11119 [Colletotrichum truncatum]KAF6786248.1 hypothetical protein CTRU02_11119 [Colletotrichum truncatum]
MKSVVIISILSAVVMALPHAGPATDAAASLRRGTISQEELGNLASKTGKTVDEISEALYSTWAKYQFSDEDIAALAASKVKRGKISQEELGNLASKTGKTVDEISEALYSTWAKYQFSDDDIAALAASKN